MRIVGANTLNMVAPYTGAWIETIYTNLNTGFLKVAPYTGAWIETSRQQS